MAQLPKRLVNEIIIHCAATPNGQWFDASDIDRWHKERGFRRRSDAAQYSPHKHIGYHFVIGVRGGVEVGRLVDEVGSHCTGYNSHSIGICLIGTDRYTPQQWESLTNLVRSLQDQHKIKHIIGHRDTSPDRNNNGRVDKSEWLKTCPGFDVKTWLDGGMQPLADCLLLETDAHD